MAQSKRLETIKVSVRTRYSPDHDEHWVLLADDKNGLAQEILLGIGRTPEKAKEKALIQLEKVIQEVKLSGC